MPELLARKDDGAAMAKAVISDVRSARLRAAQAVLEDADSAVHSYEYALRRAPTREDSIEMKAYLDIWLRIQRLAANDIRKYDVNTIEKAR
jgi:hypothetical protein